MSITGTKKRIACFYDDKGEFLDKKSFSKTAKTLDYDNKTYNVFQDNATITKIKRWYWDLELYHYNINNPNPMVLNKKLEPILDAEMYNIQLKTKVARDLNDLANPGFKLNWKTGLIAVAVIVIIYMVATGGIKLK
jgi:hypothetical protein